MASRKAKRSKAEAGAKAATVRAGGGKKAWIISGVMLLALAGLGLQTYVMARQQAKLKFDMLRVGRIIPQGRDKGQGMAVVNFEGDKQDNLYFLEGDANNPPRLQKFDPMNNYVTLYEPAKPEQLIRAPRDLTTDAQGRVYVLLEDGRIHVLDSDLKYQKTLKTGVVTPVAVGVDSQGRLFVASQSNNKIQVFDSEGRPVMEFGAPGSGKATIVNPVRMRVSSDDVVVVLESLPTGLRCKTFDVSGGLKRVFEIKKINNCPPLRMGVNTDGMLFINDHLGSRGIVVYNIHTGKFVGDSQATQDGEKFVSPGAAGANKWTRSAYVHTVPGLIKCLIPTDEEVE